MFCQGWQFNLASSETLPGFIVEYINLANLLTNSLSVIPALEVHVLSNKFYGGLGTIHFQCRHVEVINEENEVLPEWRSKHTFTSEINRNLYSTFHFQNEPPHDKTNKVTVCPAKTQSSLGISPVWSGSSLKKAWVLSYPLSAQQRLRSDWADAQADLSLCWRHMPFCWFCHEAPQIVKGFTAFKGIKPWQSQAEARKPKHS